MGEPGEREGAGQKRCRSCYSTALNPAADRVPEAVVAPDDEVDVGTAPSSLATSFPEESWWNLAADMAFSDSFSCCCRLLAVRDSWNLPLASALFVTNNISLLGAVYSCKI